MSKLTKSVAVGVFLTIGSMAQAEGQLNVALDGTFAPHAMPKLDGSGVEGFNVDFALELGKRLNREMNITAAQWSGLLPAMQAGTYDFLVAPTTVTAERSENMLFSEGYLDTDYQFITKADADEIGDLTQMNGKVIAVNKGSNYHRWADENASRYGWTVQSYGTASDAIAAVLSGRAFASMAGNTVMAWAVKKNPQLKLSVNVPTGKIFAVPFRKDDTETRRMVENAIECMKLDGTFVALSEKWFGVTPAAGSAAVTVFPGYGVPGLAGHEDVSHEPNCS